MFHLLNSDSAIFKYILYLLQCRNIMDIHNPFVDNIIYKRVMSIHNVSILYIIHRIHKLREES